MATENLKLRKNIKKIISSEAVNGTKLKPSRNVKALASTKTAFFLFSLLVHFRCYGNLKFPLTYNGESEKWPLLLSNCRYSDKHLADLFLE